MISLRFEVKPGYITLDEGYGNTGSCKSNITFIDGEKGILRYRGIPIEELAEKSTFVETAYLIIYGKLPNSQEMKDFSNLLTKNEMLHEDMKFHFEGFPAHAHPMAILSSMINAAGCFLPEVLNPDEIFSDASCTPSFSSANDSGILLSKIAWTPDHLSETNI